MGLGGENIGNQCLEALGSRALLWRANIWCDRKRERQNGSRPVERDRSKEAKAVRSGLRPVACLPPGVMVMSGSGLQPKPMSVALLQPLSVLMSVAPVTTKDQEDKRHRVGPDQH